MDVVARAINFDRRREQRSRHRYVDGKVYIGAKYHGVAQLLRISVTHALQINGIPASGDDDVVLLNSDTQVGPRWLDRLRQTAYSDASVGTVTAVSDNAGAFSVPGIERYCPVPTRWTLQQTQRALLQRVASPSPELSTGNGYAACSSSARCSKQSTYSTHEGFSDRIWRRKRSLPARGTAPVFAILIAGDVFVAHLRAVPVSAKQSSSRAYKRAGRVTVLRLSAIPITKRKSVPHLYAFCASRS